MDDLLTLTKEEATQFFIEFYCGEHHFPSELKRFGHGWAILDHNELASFDYNHLTRLVVMAHDKSIRVGIQPASNRALRITLHKREKGSTNDMNRHPDLESAIDFIRRKSIVNQQSSIKNY